MPSTSISDIDLMKLRSGIGYDTHIFKSSKKFILGGAKIPYKKGLLGHSDADVLIHSIIDAILGAAGLSDIGTMFPDTDKKFKNINSTILLEEIYKKITIDYRIINIDSVIICQKPKLSPYIPEMKKNLGSILHTENINIKATTTEKMNAEGKGKAVSCQAVCLLLKL